MDSTEGYVPAGKGPGLIGVHSMFIALTTVFIAIRIYVRGRLIKNVGPDDYTAVASWVLFVAFASCSITGAHHGTGQHAWLIKPATQLPIALKWWWACEPLYVLSTMMVKFSIAIQLLRFSKHQPHRYIIWITTAIAQTYSVAFFFICVFQCYPPTFFWTQLQGDTNGSCLPFDVLINTFYVYSVICCIVDWTFAIVPYFLVKDLQMNKRKKLLVSLVLAMAALASTATIIRLPYIHLMNDRADFLFATTDVANWSCAETGIAIIASAAATFRPLFHKFLERSKYAEGSVPLKNASAWHANTHKRGYVRSTSPDSSVGNLPATHADLMTITKATTVDITHVRASG